MLKRKSKRVLSIVLAVAMIVGLFPIAAFAEGGETATPVDQNTETVATKLPGAVDGVITLTEDVDISTSGYTVSGNITIDLAGHDLKVANTETGRILVPRNTSLTLRDSSVNSSGRVYTESNYSNTASSGMISVQGGTFTMDSGNIDAVRPEASNNGQFAIGVFQGGSVIINGGKIEAGWYAISGNGTEQSTSTTITINGGTLVSTADYALYLPQNGVTTINDGIVTGAAGGIAQRSGKLIINGGTIASEGTGNTGEWGDGTGGLGDAAVNIGDSTQGLYGDVSVSITGGNFTAAEDAVSVNVGEDLESHSTNIIITGGFFADDVSEYIPDGNKWNSDTGEIVIDETKAVASVKDVGYTSLQEAIDAAEKSKGTVTLLKNIDLTDGVEISGTVTLDLNGFTITDSVTQWSPSGKVDYLLAVKRGADLTINDSSVEKTGAITTRTESIYCAVKLTLPADSENEKATLTVNGGTLTGYYYGISGNGARHNTDITINDGIVEGTNGTGIYQPQEGTVTINGGTITGLTGIEIRSGQLDVNGGTFISTADKYEAVKNDSGTTVTGAAIAVSQHTTDKKITVTVDGGTFEGPKSFVETDVQKAPVTGSSATINNGTFVGEVSSADFTNIVKGGQFSAPVVTNLLDDTLTAQLQSTSNTTAPYYSYYTSVEAAIAAAQPGDKVVDLSATGTTTNYTVTIKYNNGDKDLTLTVPENKELTLPAAPSRADYTFDGWIINGEKYAAGQEVKITADTEISADWQPPYTGKYSYEIFTTVGDNGAIDVDRYATEGDKVTITVSPDEAYMLDDMTVTSGGKDVEVTDNGDGTYTFTMPSGDVKIEVTFAEDPNWEEEPAMPFVDVDENDWFYDVVLYAYENGLMTGTSADTFAPNQTTTRGMIVSMLARLEGVTSAEDAGFADVAANDWYATAVNWAASVGVVNGYEDNTFRPNDAITREQMAAILYNYADYKGYDVSARADLSDYADAASISSWAEDVLAWANAEGLINGMTATTIDPQGATTRAQTAAMFERFLTAHEA